MIEFIEINDSEPYKLFISKYNKAFLNKEKNIEAVAVSSFNKEMQEVHSRFVNLKYIKNSEWIFFSNYESQKAKDFQTHNQVSAVFFWRSTNTQIILKANINQTESIFSDKHFLNRTHAKNSLALSSNQSNIIETYDDIKKKYNKIFKSKQNLKRPHYWGGFSFVPYYFEFWEGNESRINHRKIYKLIDNKWASHLLEP